MKRLIHIVLGAVFRGPLLLVRLLGRRHRLAKCVVILGLGGAALFLIDGSGNWSGTEAQEQSTAMPKTARERMLAMSRGTGPVQVGQHEGEVLGIDDPDVPPPFRGMNEEELARALERNQVTAESETGNIIPPPYRGMGEAELAHHLDRHAHGAHEVTAVLTGQVLDLLERFTSTPGIGGGRDREALRR